MSTETAKKRPGYLVKVKSGKGRTYHDEGLVNGKVRVHLLGDDFTPTGDKVLVRKEAIEFRGFLD